MKVELLSKDPTSGNGACDSVWLGDTGKLVIQAQQADAETFANLENVLAGEAAVVIDPAIVLDAVERYKARIATG